MALKCVREIRPDEILYADYIQILLKKEKNNNTHTTYDVRGLTC